MSSVQYKLDRFEGPLDLLLSLVEKNKINIDDIPISLLCSQYMDYIHAAQEMDIELSSEFIVMASELMLIKSKMLLPRNEEAEEDPRAALAAAMLEYQRTKAVSASLTRMFSQFGARMVKETDEIKADTSFVADHDMRLLTRAMMRMMSEVRITEEEVLQRFEPLIRQNPVSVAEVASSLLTRLQSGQSLSLQSVFSTATSRSSLIAMFMAMLELLKSGTVLLEENEYTPDGVIHSAADVTVSLNPEADLDAAAKFLKDEANF